MQTIEIYGIVIECSWMGYRIIHPDENIVEKISSYLFKEGFVKENQIILIG